MLVIFMFFGASTGQLTRAMMLLFFLNDGIFTLLTWTGKGYGGNGYKGYGKGTGKGYGKGYRRGWGKGYEPYPQTGGKGGKGRSRARAMMLLF